MRRLSGRVIVMTAFMGSAVMAQTVQTAPARVAVRVVQIKQDMVNDFFDIVRTELVPMWKKAGIPWVTVSAPVFGSMGEFSIVMPATKLADFNENLFIKTLGPERGDRLMAKLRRCTEKGTFLIATAHPDLSISHQEAPAPFSVVTHVDVAPTKTMQFTSWVKDDLVPALRKAEVLNFEVYSATFGAEVNHFVSIQGLKDLGQLDGPGPLERSMTRDAMQTMLAKQAGIITRVERYVTRVIPELSYGPAQRAAR